MKKSDLISEKTIKLIQSWQHTGFHVHSGWFGIMARYYGWYSNKKRGMRKKEGKLNLSAVPAQADKTTTLSEDLTDYQKSCRKQWAALIRKIYEADSHCEKQFPI